MTIDGTFLRSFNPTVDWLYAGLMRSAALSESQTNEHGLGGTFLYAGELDPAGCALAVAGNIAGTATLAASADVATQKQAIRDGVVDFLVTNLDEALRILKNELRKRETVAVCVAKSPEEVESEMQELGVLPDLLPPGTIDADRFEPFIWQGARQVDPIAPDDHSAVLTWKVGHAPAIWLPRMDAIAGDCLEAFPSPHAAAAKRWLRLAPRFLGRQAMGSRLLRCDAEAAREFLNRVREKVQRRELNVEVEICLTIKGDSLNHELSPPPKEASDDVLTFATAPRLRSAPTTR
jgi:hypothetical protein